MTEDFMSFHLRRTIERDLASVRSNLSDEGTPLWTADAHRSHVMMLEAAICEAGGDAAYVAARVRQMKAEREALRLQTESIDRTLESFGLPATGGKLVAEDDSLRMIGVPSPDELFVSEKRLEARAREWAHGPHERGHALEHKPGRDAVVGEVIDKKAGRHCRGPRLKAKADLIQILWAIFVKRFPRYDAKRWSVENFAAVVANSGIKESIRKDARRRSRTPKPEMLASELAARLPDAPDRDVELDVRKLLLSLSTSDMSIVRARLKHDSDTAAARSLGMKRQTFVDRLRAIKSKLFSQLPP
jgi:hypothetical protein